MYNSELSKIRRDNITRVLAELRARGAMSRAGLSELTGLSLMTIGKTVDQLEGLGVITQKKSDDSSAGRKSLLAALDSGKRFSIYDCSTRDRRLYLTDQAGSLIAEYPIADGGFEDARAAAFMECLSDGGELVGCGVILPDFEPQVTFREFVSENGSRPDAAMRRIEAAALGCAVEERSALHLCYGEPPSAVFITDGKIYRGANGNAVDIKGLTELCGDLCGALRALRMVLDCELVRVEFADSQTLESASRELLSRLAGEGMTFDFVLNEPRIGISALAAALLERRISLLLDT